VVTLQEDVTNFVQPKENTGLSDHASVRTDSNCTWGNDAFIYSYCKWSSGANRSS